MHELTHYVRQRLSAGADPAALFRELTAAGWPPAQADAAVRQLLGPAPAQPADPSPPAAGTADAAGRGSRGLLMGSIAAALASVLPLIIIPLVALLAGPGIRGSLQGAQDAFPIMLWLLIILIPLWCVALVLLILSRRKPPAPPRKLWGWALGAVLAAPLLGTLMLIGTLIFTVALGIMCGEAQSVNCGLA
ncbi:hypothetical protein [Leucobacter sp. M11]|uniref:hypothetical protein n=1 Tax=Leucobacter sp. M11 TaxID=2993565 RepID=UPI002D80DC57|nr:hypothetical protein [Leucobacter sp. M11]MEB4613547.1 hypothetical protein [Leucobacter sp. M11]